jgi:hypothetical protein
LSHSGFQSISSQAFSPLTPFASVHIGRAFPAFIPFRRDKLQLKTNSGADGGGVSGLIFRRGR